MFRLAFVFSLVTLTAFSLDGLIVGKVDTTVPISCSFSTRNQNRILVKNGIVKKVICPEGFFSIQMESESGQAFVFPLRSFSGELTLSVITGSGQVQDLSVSVHDGASEVVVISDECMGEEEDYELLAITQKEKEVLLVKDLLLGRTPVGYVPHYGKKIQHSSSLVQEGAWEGPYEYVIQYRFSKPGRIQEENIDVVGKSWVFIEESKLSPGNSTRIFVGVKK